MSNQDNVYDIADVIAEIQGDRAPIRIRVGDATFEIPQPELWPDEALRVGEEPLEMAPILLGEHYEAFVKAGGNAFVFAKIIEKAKGVGVGESSAS